jgi:shikimate kinase
LNEFVAKHLFDRSFYYLQAQYIVSTDEKSIAEIAKEISKIYLNQTK